MKNRIFAVLGSLALFASAINAAPTTFAQFSQQDSNNGFTYSYNGTSTGTLSANYFIDFKFLVPVAAQYSGTLSAQIIVNATSNTAASNNATTWNETGFFGTIQILGTGALTGVNLLTANFTGGPGGAVFQAQSGGTSATFSASTPPATEVVFSSAVLNFPTPIITQAFALSFSSANPAFPATGTGANTETMSATGTFSAEPTPGVPEPATMSLIGSAFLGLGILGYRRKKA